MLPREKDKSSLSLQISRDKDKSSLRAARGVEGIGYLTDATGAGTFDGNTDGTTDVDGNGVDHYTCGGRKYGGQSGNDNIHADEDDDGAGSSDGATKIDEGYTNVSDAVATFGDDKNGDGNGTITTDGSDDRASHGGDTAADDEGAASGGDANGCVNDRIVVAAAERQGSQAVPVPEFFSKMKEEVNITMCVADKSTRHKELKRVEKIYDTMNWMTEALRKEVEGLLPGQDDIDAHNNNQCDIAR